MADAPDDDENKLEKAFHKLSNTTRYTAENPPAPIDLQLFDEVLVQVLPKTGFTRKGIVSGCLPNNLYHVKIGNATYRKHRKQLMPITRNQAENRTTAKKDKKVQFQTTAAKTQPLRGHPWRTPALTLNITFHSPASRATVAVPS